MALRPGRRHKMTSTRARDSTAQVDTHAAPSLSPSPTPPSMGASKKSRQRTAGMKRKYTSAILSRQPPPRLKDGRKTEHMKYERARKKELKPTRVSSFAAPARLPRMENWFKPTRRSPTTAPANQKTASCARQASARATAHRSRKASRRASEAGSGAGRWPT